MRELAAPYPLCHRQEAITLGTDGRCADLQRLIFYARRPLPGRRRLACGPGAPTFSAIDRRPLPWEKTGGMRTSRADQERRTFSAIDRWPLLWEKMAGAQMRSTVLSLLQIGGHYSGRRWPACGPGAPYLLCYR